MTVDYLADLLATFDPDEDIVVALCTRDDTTRYDIQAVREEQGRVRLEVHAWGLAP